MMTNDNGDYPWLEYCFVCKQEEWGLPLTPCCQKPAHYHCRPASVHIEPSLHSICFILGLDGYMVLNKTFATREIRWCDMNGNAGNLHFELPVFYKALFPKDRRTVNHVYHHVHVLPLDARFQENAVDLELLEPVADMLYEKHSTHHQNLVAYKGEHVEKDLLTKLTIPHVDLEFYGCPKSNELLIRVLRPHWIVAITCMLIPIAPK